MKSYKIFCVVTAFIILLIFLLANILSANTHHIDGREYRVQIERLCNDISVDGDADIAQYPLITNVIKDDKTAGFLEGEGSDYVIRQINGELYRIEYTSRQADNDSILIINISLSVISVALACILLFIGIKIIKPFEKLKNLPFELAKGNLTIPLKENKNRYFGRFVWGMDVLREKLEKQKANELQLQKEKQTLLLSISHDIKTPLSAIRLYSQALSKNLYSDKEKQLQTAQNIYDKTYEIEQFVNHITKSAREEFLLLEVRKSVFYLDKIIDDIKKYYSDRLDINKTDFIIEQHSDCMLTGDAERSTEVLQNIIENAIKYGDGRLITIKFSDEEDCRLVTVENSGNTLAESDIAHVFESFYRGQIPLI